MTSKFTLGLVVLIQLCLARASLLIDVTVNEQYVSVLRAEEFVNPDGSVGQTPSVFVGLLFIAVIPQFAPPIGDNPPAMLPPKLQTTLWHGIAFAVNATINGPATAGYNALSSLPYITLATVNTAPSTNCPIQGLWTINAAILNYLRMGLLYVQIQTGTTTGNIRGQIYTRRDALVGFIGNVPGVFMADMGMAVFRVYPIVENPNIVYMESWIVSKYNTGNYTDIIGGINYLPVAILGAIPPGQSTPVTLFYTQPYDPTLLGADYGPVLPLGEVFTGFPIVGPGSSELILSLQPTGPLIIFSQLTRVAVYNDYLVFTTNQSSQIGAATSVSPRTLYPLQTLLALGLGLVLALVFV